MATHCVHLFVASMHSQCLDVYTTCSVWTVVDLAAGGKVRPGIPSVIISSSKTWCSGCWTMMLLHASLHTMHSNTTSSDAQQTRAPTRHAVALQVPSLTTQLTCHLLLAPPAVDVCILPYTPSLSPRGQQALVQNQRENVGYPCVVYCKIAVV